MPATETTPAAGAQVFASAQVLNRRVLIIKGGPDLGFFTMDSFGPDFDGGFRDETITPVNNLPEIAFNLFLLPSYDRGDVVFRARNYLQWRPVFRMPPDTFPEDVGTASQDWVPFCSPMLLLPGTPVVFPACCIGVEEVAVEVRVPAEFEPEADQGQDRVVVSITASQ